MSCTYSAHVLDIVWSLDQGVTNEITCLWMNQLGYTKYNLYQNNL